MPPRFNLLLSDPHEFAGGGTHFTGSGETWRPERRGEAVVHSGLLEHQGVAITSGRRLILVGFLRDTRYRLGTNGYRLPKRFRE